MIVRAHHLERFQEIECSLMTVFIHKGNGMPSELEMMPGAILNRIATYGAAREVANLCQTSRSLNASIPVATKNQVNLQDKALALEVAWNRSIPAKTSGTGLRQALSENSVLRVLYLASGGDCRKWDESVDREAFKAVKMTPAGGTPDFVYRGRLADAISVGYQQFDGLSSEQETAKRGALFPAVLSAIKSKWALYGDGCITAVDITTFPHQISTQMVVEHVMRNIVSTGGRSVFLIRDFAVERIFDS